MQYEQDHLMLDFARRTQKNLEFVEQYVAAHASEPDVELYEVTQLINSLLGLLVFPQQSFYSKIPPISLDDLRAAGWPEIKMAGQLRNNDLLGLLSYLRNAVTHCNIEFETRDGRVCGVRLWNVPFEFSRCNREIQFSEADWKASLSIEDLRKMVYRFIALLEGG